MAPRPRLRRKALDLLISASRILATRKIVECIARVFKADCTAHLKPRAVRKRSAPQWRKGSWDSHFSFHVSSGGPHGRSGPQRVCYDAQSQGVDLILHDILVSHGTRPSACSITSFSLRDQTGALALKVSSEPQRISSRAETSSVRITSRK